MNHARRPAGSYATLPFSVVSARGHAAITSTNGSIIRAGTRPPRAHRRNSRERQRRMFIQHSNQGIMVGASPFGLIFLTVDKEKVTPTPSGNPSPALVHQVRHSGVMLTPPTCARTSALDAGRAQTTPPLDSGRPCRRCHKLAFADRVTPGTGPR